MDFLSTVTALSFECWYLNDLPTLRVLGGMISRRHDDAKEENHNVCGTIIMYAEKSWCMRKNQNVCGKIIMYAKVLYAFSNLKEPCIPYGWCNSKGRCIIYIFIWFTILIYARKRSIDWYTVAKTHKMPYLCRSFCSKEPKYWWFFCGKWPAS